MALSSALPADVAEEEREQQVQHVLEDREEVERLAHGLLSLAGVLSYSGGILGRGAAGRNRRALEPEWPRFFEPGLWRVAAGLPAGCRNRAHP